MYSDNPKTDGHTPTGASRSTGPADASRQQNGLTLSPRVGRNLGPAARLTGWSNKELNQALAYIGWSGSELGKRVGYSRTQVSRWRRGHAPVPSAVEAYLRVMIRLADIVDGN
jgi:transcriptional regulator with XRE-family HTH domain